MRQDRLQRRHNQTPTTPRTDDAVPGNDDADRLADLHALLDQIDAVLEEQSRLVTFLQLPGQ
jgi:Pup-like protein